MLRGWSVLHGLNTLCLQWLCAGKTYVLMWINVSSYFFSKISDLTLMHTCLLVSTAGLLNIGATSTSLLSTMPSPGGLNLPTSPSDGSVTNAPVSVGDGDAPSVPASTESDERETGAVPTELAVGGAQAESRVCKKGKETRV